MSEGLLPEVMEVQRQLRILDRASMIAPTFENRTDWANVSEKLAKEYHQDTIFYALHLAAVNRRIKEADGLLYREKSLAFKEVLETIHKFVDRWPALGYLDKCLAPANLGFVERCYMKGRFLAPWEVDLSLLSEYNDVDATTIARSYTSRQRLVLAPRGDPHYYTFAYEGLLCLNPPRLKQQFLSESATGRPPPEAIVVHQDHLEYFVARYADARRHRPPRGSRAFARALTILTTPYVLRAPSPPN